MAEATPAHSEALARSVCHCVDMIEAVEIRDGSTLIRFHSAIDPFRDGLGIRHFTVDIEAPELNASVNADSYLGDKNYDLAGFLDRLAADWEGWQGDRTWQAPDRALTINAAHEGNRIVVRFAIRGSLGPGTTRDELGGWTVAAAATITPGEQLRGLAREVRTFLRP